jgi:hypothetical protein
MFANIRTATAGKATLDDLRGFLTGAGGASASLVTTEPAHKKPLRFSFNTELREQRLKDGFEDETDDEAVEEEEEAARRAAGAGGGEEEDGAGGAAVGGEDDDDGPVEVAGMLKHPDKPLPKRKMTTQHYEWQAKDIVNPNAPGVFDVVHKPSASRQRWLERKKKKGKAIGKGPVIGL